MKIAVIGGGYVGLVMAAGLAELGHTVICAERDSEKLRILKSLELNFLKTYVKSYEIKLAALSIKRYLSLLSKSLQFPQ